MQPGGGGGPELQPTTTRLSPRRSLCWSTCPSQEEGRGESQSASVNFRGQEGECPQPVFCYLEAPSLGRIIVAHLSGPSVLAAGIWGQALLGWGLRDSGAWCSCMGAVGIPVNWDSPRARAPASSTTEPSWEGWEPGSFQRPGSPRQVQLCVLGPCHPPPLLPKTHCCWT